jgi:hypothetical protein
MFGNASSGSFGSTNTAPTNGMFGNANGPTTTTAAPAFGGFGTTANQDKPATSGFSFGQSTTTAPAPATGTGLFGNANASTSFTFGAKEEPKPATGGFMFGQPAVKEEPKPATGGFLFGQQPAAKEEPKSTSFTFGQPAATSAPEAPKPAPAFGFFGAPEAKPAPTTSTGLFGSGLPTDAAGSKPSGFMFGQSAETKAPEPAGGSLFGKPAAAPAAPAFAFGQQQQIKETPAASTSLFSKPAEPNKPTFGFGAEKKDEAPKFGVIQNGQKEQPLAKAPLFGFVPPGAVAQKEEPEKPSSMELSKPTSMELTKPAPMFGAPAPEKQDTPMFGTSPAEKKEEPSKSLFGTAPPPITTGGGFMFGAAKPAEKPAEKPSISSSLFGSKPTDFKPAAEPKAAPAPPSFFAPSAANNTTTSAFSAPAPPSEVRMRSPPLPADSHNWSANQLTDYYNLFAIRSLNHLFKEELAKQDIFADLTPLCDAYIAERHKIVELMEKNQRYKFVGESTLGSGVPGKRAGEDNDNGGGKRRALGEGN